jgi:uncharacterized protein (TIGR02246 family)
MPGGVKSTAIAEGTLHLLLAISGLGNGRSWRCEEQKRLVDTWIAATQNGDLRALLKLMADDVVFMVPGQRPFGKAAFAISFRQMKDVSISATSDIQEIEIFADWAYMRNYLEITMAPTGVSGPIRRSGPTLTILRKRPDGQWVIARDSNLLAGG